jgi:hypothetical protein
MPQAVEELLSLTLYLLIITFLTLLQHWHPKRKYPPRFSCLIKDGKVVEESKKYF